MLTMLTFREDPLLVFGWVCLVATLVCAVLSVVFPVQVAGTNSWYKPLKFFISVAVYSGSIAWYTSRMGFEKPGIAFSWAIVVLLGFELVYITVQAARGQMSHFNLSSPIYSLMFNLMAVAAAMVSVLTAWLAWRFFTVSLPDIPDHLLWAMRFGLIWFVLFSLEGFAMGARLSHTVGAADGGDGVPVLNWSKTHGDLRIAHFVGMHALQVLPLVALWIFRDRTLVIVCSLLYGLLSGGMFIWAWQGRSLFR